MKRNDQREIGSKFDNVSPDHFDIRSASCTVKLTLTGHASVYSLDPILRSQ